VVHARTLHLRKRIRVVWYIWLVCYMLTCLTTAVKATQRLEQRMKENAVAAVIDFIIDQALAACLPADPNPRFDAFHGAMPSPPDTHASAHPTHDARGASVTQERLEQQQSTHVAPESWEEGDGDGDAELRAWEAKRHANNVKVGCVCMRVCAIYHVDDDALARA
jgi:hypothetical protein